MDGRLTDLDALALTVRNPLSRNYIDEAVKAYRAGSYKAAIVAVWVALTFDIIAKIRELAGQADADAWRDSVIPTLVGLIDTADDAHLPSSYALLASFADVRAALPGPAIGKLAAYLENMEPAEDDVRAFDAVRLPEFRAQMIEKFTGCEENIQAAVLRRHPAPELWATALSIFSKAGSYRGAEYRFERYIAPYQDTASLHQMEQVFEAVGRNGQIYHAAEVPFQLADFVGRVGRRAQLSEQSLAALVAMTDADPRNRRAPFRPVFEIFETAGLNAPPFAPPNEEG